MKLLRGLLTAEKAYTGPYHVTVDLTSRCNMHCLGCRYNSPQVDFPYPGDKSIPDIPFDLIKQLCTDLKFSGTNDIILTGEGEPLLHPRVFDIISEIKTTGFYLTLITNGTLFNQDVVNKLIDARLDSLKVSLWASSPEQYRLCYPGTNPQNFEKTIEGLKLFASIKTERKSTLPVVIMHHVINRYNYRHILEMVDLAKETGCDALAFAPFKAWKGHLKEASISPEEVTLLEDLLNRARKRLNGSNIRHNVSDALLRFRIGEKVWEQLPCYIAWFHSRIKLDGTVLPCDPCDLPMGNLHEKTLPEIWNDRKYREFRNNALTREGLSAMGKYLDCGYCCHLVHNARINRFFRWIPPFFRTGLKGPSKNTLGI